MSGVFVTGHVRSGTSMVAGLFAAHGVFFGDCGGGVPDNPKGRFENVWLKRTMHDGAFGDWPRTWFDRLGAEGWDGEPWGAKLMPKWWEYMKETEPGVVVLCYRPEQHILASCDRVGWNRSSDTVRQRWDAMEDIRREAGVCCEVFTPHIVRGCYAALKPAFDALGIEFSEEIAEDWIEPDWFHV